MYGLAKELLVRLNAGEKKRGKNNSDMANPGKKSEKDGGGGLKSFFYC